VVHDTEMVGVDGCLFADLNRGYELSSAMVFFPKCVPYF